MTSMKDQLAMLCDRLDQEGTAVMSEIYALTSSHLYGLIYKILPDEGQASKVLKTVFAELWQRRREINQGSINPLTFMRSLAHRYALDLKLSQDINYMPSMDQKTLGGTNLAVLKLENIKASDRDFLKQAYTNGKPIEVLPGEEDSNVTDLNDRLNQIVTQARKEES